jgi:hypothetical protein
MINMALIRIESIKILELNMIKNDLCEIDITDIQNDPSMKID